MKLSMWTYEGPPHVGAMRIAASMTGVHYVLHAPQGDTYADLLFTMIERRASRPPVTYTTFQARDLSGSTADIFKTACRDAVTRFQPQALLVGASCTAELLQDDPGGLARTLDVSVPVVPLELPSYQKKENWGASETFYRLVRAFAGSAKRPADIPANSCNILGPTSLGFRCRDDVTEIVRLLTEEGLDVRVVAPLGASPDDLARLPDAAFNIVLYPEIADVTARWLKKTHGMPFVSTVPIGIGATQDFLAEVRAMAGLAPGDADDAQTSGRDRLTWYARSSTATTSPTSASSSSAMRPMRLPPRVLPRRSLGSGSAALAPICANSPARSARRLKPMALRRWSATIISMSRRPSSQPGPNWCWAPRWNAISPSVCGCPVP